MSEVLLTNIFFIITSVAVVIFTILLCIVLYHFIKILRTVRDITEKVKEGSEVVMRDVSELRERVLSNNLLATFVKLISPKGSPRRKPVKKADSNDQEYGSEKQ